MYPGFFDEIEAHNAEIQRAISTPWTAEEQAAAKAERDANNEWYRKQQKTAKKEHKA